MVKQVYIPDRGHAVWVDLDPTKGHEQRNTRPAVVLSPRMYNKKTGLMVVVPVTSQGKGYPFEVACQGKKVTGVILSDQVRTLDWHARKVRYIEKVHAQSLTKVQKYLISLVTK